MANPIRYFPCPACNQPLAMKSSRMITSSVREQYSQCDNPHCGGGFVMRTEIVNQLNPTGDMFAGKTDHIPNFSDENKKALDIALSFVATRWQNRNSTESLFVECVDYLKDILQISNERAVLVVRLAFADQERIGYEQWSVDTEHYSSAVIVNEGMTTQHVVSVKDLAEFIQQQKQQLL